MWQGRIVPKYSHSVRACNQGILFFEIGDFEQSNFGGKNFLFFDHCHRSPLKQHRGDKYCGKLSTCCKVPYSISPPPSKGFLFESSHAKYAGLSRCIIFQNWFSKARFSRNHSDDAERVPCHPSMIHPPKKGAFVSADSPTKFSKKRLFYDRTSKFP